MKKLLLITIPLSGYEKKIIKALEKKGFEVTFFPEASKLNKREITFFHRLLRTFVNDLGFGFLRGILARKDTKIYKAYIEKLESDYDFIFDFGGKGKEQSLKLLKNKYKSKFILYMWDDLFYANTVWNTMKFFDEKYIFNNKDLDKYNFKYRSNFFVDEYLYCGEDKKIDVFYKGSLRDKKRTIIIEEIAKELSEYNLEISLYAKGTYLKNIKKVHSKEFFENMCNDKYMTLEELALKYKSSKLILDISYKNQSGLGLRPLEAIAANCKLITTNENIKNYEFYNENNIFYLEENFSNIKELKKIYEYSFCSV